MKLTRAVDNIEKCILLRDTSCYEFYNATKNHNVVIKMNLRNIIGLTQVLLQHSIYTKRKLQ